MARQARCESIDPQEVQVVHAVQRCVRQAFLCGIDKNTGNNYEHRRQWIRNRLEFLASVFGIDCLTYTVMSNHIHLVLRTRPDVVKSWSDDGQDKGCQEPNWRSGNDARNATLSGSNHAADDLGDGDAAGPMANSSTSTGGTTSSPGDFVVSGGLSNTATLTNLSTEFNGELETDSESTYRFDGGVATSLTTYRGNTGDNSNLDGPASTRDQLNLESDQVRQIKGVRPL